MGFFSIIKKLFSARPVEKVASLTISTNTGKIESLIDEISADYEEYQKTALAHTQEAERLFAEYEAFAKQLLVKRETLRIKTTQLYKALSRLIGVGEEITEHDELVATPDFPSQTPVLPILLLELGLDAPINELKRKFKNHDDLDNIAAKYHDRKLEFSEDLWEKKGYVDALSTAVKIAEKYLELSDIVETAINKSLLPEIRAVHGFLLADTIKNHIAVDKTFTEINPKPISDYRGQDNPYRQHHVFVKNAVDYYITVCRLLVEPYIQRLIADKKAAKDIGNEFEMFYKDVGSNLEAVSQSVVLIRPAHAKK